VQSRYLAACTGSAAVTGEAILGITDLRIYQNDADGRLREGMRLHPDGRLELLQDSDPAASAWEDVGWRVADGTLYYITQHVGHLHPDGTERTGTTRSARRRRCRATCSRWQAST
jgi:hypothetical protein